MDDDDPTTTDLFIAAVLKIAGPDGLAKVRAIAGGSGMTVPIYATERSVIARALGLENARRVCAELRVFDAEGRATACPGFYLPRGTPDFSKRRERVRELRLQGKVRRDIAIELGVSDNTVARDIRVLQEMGRLPLERLTYNPHTRTLLAPPSPKCGVLPSPDHPANVGGMVAPPADEVP